MLAPLRIEWRDPVGLGSADSAGACKCDDGLEYALKDGRHHPQTPHNEWFCTRLAESVGIPCPPCAVIQDEHGNFIFGSRWEGGLARDKWWDMVARGDIDLASISPALSRILAFDHFVFNDDRHLNNYLVRNSRNGWVVLAFDFSRAWRYHGFPPARLPFAVKQNTRKAYRILRLLIGDFLDQSVVGITLDRIEGITTQTIENIIAMHPKDWLTQADIDATMKWWKAAARSQRLESIRKGIGNGTFL